MKMVKDSLSFIHSLKKEEIDKLIEEHRTAPHERKLQKKIS